MSISKILLSAEKFYHGTKIWKTEKNMSSHSNYIGRSFLSRFNARNTFTTTIKPLFRREHAGKAALAVASFALCFQVWILHFAVIIILAS